jgi:hypothetical protein
MFFSFKLTVTSCDDFTQQLVPLIFEVVVVVGLHVELEVADVGVR